VDVTRRVQKIGDDTRAPPPPLNIIVDGYRTTDEIYSRRRQRKRCSTKFRSGSARGARDKRSGSGTEDMRKRCTFIQIIEIVIQRQPLESNACLSIRLRSCRRTVFTPYFFPEPYTPARRKPTLSSVAHDHVHTLTVQYRWTCGRDFLHLEFD
jgi:hypothetical protein